MYIVSRYDHDFPPTSHWTGGVPVSGQWVTHCRVKSIWAVKRAIRQLQAMSYDYDCSIQVERSY